MTLKAPALAAFGRTLLSASHTAYLRQVEAAQTQLVHNVQAAIPQAQVRWRYHLVADGFAVVVPRADVARAARFGLATLSLRADVAELVDAHGSGPCGRKLVEVQVLSSA